jgi:CCR4-NOT transcriptional regulation complex NOT5 subunit
MSKKQTIADTLVQLIEGGVHAVDEVKSVEVLKSDTIRLNLLEGVQIDLLVQPRDIWLRDDNVYVSDKLKEIQKRAESMEG